MMYLGDKPVKAIAPLLPNEYQEVEYIESTGTQYIDTGFYANQDTSVKMLVRSNSVANQAFFCSRTALKKATYSCFIVNNYIRHDYNEEQKQTSVQAKAGLLYDICAEKNILKVNGIVSTIAQGTFTASYSMRLGASFDGSLTQNYLVGRIYSCQIYDNDILVRNFIPCYRKPDNVIGLYDTVNKSFYTNKGTGTFLKGENKTTTQLFTVPIKKCVGKNLFDISKLINTTVDGDYFKGAGAGKSFYNLRVTPGKTYTVTYTINTGYDGIGSQLSMSVIAGKNKGYSGSKPLRSVLKFSGGEYSVTTRFTVPENVTWVSFSTIGHKYRADNFMINEGDVSHYEPYTEWYEY